MATHEVRGERSEVDISFLRKSKGGHLTDVRKKYSLLEEGLALTANLSELESMLADYEESFSKFMSAHELYLATEMNEKRRVEAIELYEIEQSKYLSLQVSVHKLRQGPTGDQGRLSQLSSRSQRSSRSSVSERKRLAAAKLKLQALSKKHALESKLAEESTKFKQQLELLDATTELKIAEECALLEEEACNEDGIPLCISASGANTSEREVASHYHQSITSPQQKTEIDNTFMSPSQPFQTHPTNTLNSQPVMSYSIPNSSRGLEVPSSQPSGGNYYPNIWPGRGSAPFPTETQNPVIHTNSIRDARMSTRHMRQGVGLATSLVGLHPNMQTAQGGPQSMYANDFLEPWLFIADTIRQGPSLPKIELLKFSGNPREYIEFITNFRGHMETQVTDNSQRLIRLIAQCTGKAKEAIKSCVSLPSCDGYSQALRTLYENFGRPHIVADAYITTLKDLRVKAADATSLMEFSRNLDDVWRALSSMGRNYAAHLDNEETIKMVMRKLPFESMKRKWTERAGDIIMNNGTVTFVDFVEFVKRSGLRLNNTYGSELRVGTLREKGKDPPKVDARNTRVTTLATQSKNNAGQKHFPPCPKCRGPHGLWACDAFKEIPVSSREKAAKEFKVCLSCLAEGHFVKDCKRKFSCRVKGCSSRHHTLLHSTSNSQESLVGSTVASQFTETGATEYTAINTDQTPNTCVGAVKANRPRVCFKILPVKVRKVGTDNHMITFAFLDSGSDSTLCLQSLTNDLNLESQPISITMETTNGKRALSCDRVNFEVSPLQNDKWFGIQDALTTENIPVSRSHLANECDLQKWPHLKDVPLCDVPYGKVTILIGNDHPELVETQLSVKIGAIGDPMAVETPLGWTVCGPVELKPNKDNSSSNFFIKAGANINSELHRLYDADFVGPLFDLTEIDSVEDSKATAIMQYSAKLVDGHYQVGLPFRRKSAVFPDSRPTAVKRLHYLKKRFERDPTFQSKYTSVMKKYEEEGAAAPISPEQLKQLQPIWYLPHHAVWHPRKPQEPRIVFDCAAKTNGISLNDRLLKGPDNTSSLLGVLLRFRLKRVGVAADIKRMFHQVYVPPEDRGALCYLWWPDGAIEAEPQTYTMLTHLFGAKSSPSVCGFALRKTAEDNSHDFHESTIDAVYNSFYVDDLLKSFESEAEAIKIIEELCVLLKRGGFTLTKFISSSRKVLDAIPIEERAASTKDLDLRKDILPSERALGVYWDVEYDTFNLQVGDKDYPKSRRGILSSVASIYDPLGFASPILLPGRLINQDLCKQNYGWEDALPQAAIEKWEKWRKGLSELKGFGFKRHIRPQDFGDSDCVELHHFCDASERFGYGTVSYLRFVNESGNVQCSYIYGKSKVKPLRQGITVPKLELTAATVLVSVHQTITKEIAKQLNISNVYFWTDSTIVLKYLRNSTKRFTTFVGNRVAKIKEGSEVSQWHHVPSELNPADLASRGIEANEEQKKLLWLHGPEFLWKGMSEWPIQPADIAEELGDDEEGVTKDKRCTAMIDAVACEINPVMSLCHKISSWTKLRRVVGWVLRTVKCWKNRSQPKGKERREIEGLSVQELEDAEKEIIRAVQRESFESLGPNGKAEGKLVKLKPFYEDGILRVGGRLNRSSLPFDAKHPMIIPSKHHITELLIRHIHQQNGHAGSQQVLAHLRQKFWVVSGLSSVRRVLRKCHICKRQTGKVGEQLTSPLPVVRVSSDAHRLIHPFSAVGIDLFGPLLTCKYRKTRSAKEAVKNKRYGCIFTCLRYRAVHIELVNDLSTDSFINAVLRFISRRGSPHIVYSDNGSNFRGAEVDVLQALKAWDVNKIERTLSERSVQWYFNPPAASHQGGVWERLIRSIRRILHSIIGQELLDDETLHTFLCEVERILNDRPITRVSSDPMDYEALTPSHILLLRQNLSISPREFQEEEKYKGRWKYVNILAERFWNRWMKEYLPTLQECQKWLKMKANFKEGDLVLVVDRSVPRGQWQKGIIEEAFPDTDGLVRRVMVRTATGILVRDIRKICMLEEDLLKIIENSKISASE